MAHEHTPAWRALDVTGATSDQTAELVSDNRHREMYVVLNVTAGATLQLTIALVVALEDGTEVEIAETQNQVTGVEQQITLIASQVAAGPGSLETLQVHLPLAFKLRVKHGNANPATYTLDAVWA